MNDNVYKSCGEDRFVLIKGFSEGPIPKATHSGQGSMDS